jgi:hypothetical protein
VKQEGPAHPPGVAAGHHETLIRPGPLRSGSLLRTVGLVVTGLIAGLTLFSVPLRLTTLRSVCTAPPCTLGQLTEDGVRTLQDQGLSLGAYAGITATLDVAAAAAYLVVAFLLLRRKGTERMALFVGWWFVGLSLDIFLLPTFAGRWSSLDRLVTLNYSLSIGIGLVVFAALFPDGRFVPGWMRWVVLVAAVEEIPRVLFPSTPLSPDAWPAGLQAVEELGWVIVIVGAQIYRYRWVSGPLERQQTKWVVLGVAGVLAANMVAVFVPLLVPGAARPGSLGRLASTALVDLAILATPLVIAIAILRHRLFEIDRLLNRTLVYGLLSAILGLTYAGIVLLLGQLAGGVRGDPPSWAVAGATLAVAALFQPARRRIQQVVDRRFNRRKYHAAQTIEAYSVRLRDQLDLDTLSAELLAVVDQTMEPTQISLWLRPSPPGSSGTARSATRPTPWAY